MSARNPSRPRFVLAGCGEIGTLAHLPALSALSAEGALELAAVCDSDPRRAEEAARRFGVANFGTDWRRVARETEADAISVCLPPGPNAQVAAEAVREGLHVLCEKPPGRNAAEALLMAEAAAERPDRVTMVAFNRRYAPLYRRARERSEAIGRPQSFFARFTRGAIGQDPSNTVSDWLTSDGSHALDLAVVGSPERLTVARRGVGSGPDNVWIIQFENPRGAASVWLDFAAGRRLERFEWAGPGYAWNDLRGQTVGLVGWGHTARRFAELLAPFDCTVLVCSEHADEAELARFGARRASLGEAVASARVVSLHKGLTDRTRGLLSRDVLDLLPKGSVLVNTARAELVDAEALVARARRGDMVAALDVFHREPLPKRDPLRTLPNVILSPHNASTTPQCARRVGEQALRTLLAWGAGEPVEALPANRLEAMS